MSDYIGLPSMRVGQGEVGSVVVAICVWGGRPWWRSRSQSWRSSLLIAPPSGVAGWKCGGGESTPLLDTSGLDSCRLPPILPPHRRLTPAMGTLGTVCSIATLCSPFRSVASFNLDDSTLTIFHSFPSFSTFLFPTFPSFCFSFSILLFSFVLFYFSCFFPFSVFFPFTVFFPSLFSFPCFLITSNLLWRAVFFFARFHFSSGNSSRLVFYTPYGEIFFQTL